MIKIENADIKSKLENKTKECEKIKVDLVKKEKAFEDRMTSITSK